MKKALNTIADILLFIIAGIAVAIIIIPIDFSEVIIELGIGILALSLIGIIISAIANFLPAERSKECYRGNYGQDPRWSVGGSPTCSFSSLQAAAKERIEHEEPGREIDFRVMNSLMD